jgi:hypothetical protein
MNALDSSFWFQSGCWYFWQGLSVFLCPLLKLVCSAVGQCMLQLPVRQLLGKGSALCVWAQALSGGMGHWHRCVLWSGPLRSQYATACRPSVGNRSESLSIAFLLKNYQFQLTIVFSKVEECCFHCLCRVHSPLHKLDQLSILPLQHQAEVKCSLRLFGHQFYLENGGQSADQVHWSMWFHPE